MIHLKNVTPRALSALLEAALDQRQPTRALRTALNRVLVQAEHPDRFNRVVVNPRHPHSRRLLWPKPR